MEKGKQAEIVGDSLTGAGLSAIPHVTTKLRLREVCRKSYFGTWTDLLHMYVDLCKRSLIEQLVLVVLSTEAFDLQGLIRSSSAGFHETGQLIKFEKREKALKRLLQATFGTTARFIGQTANSVGNLLKFVHNRADISTGRAV